MQNGHVSGGILPAQAIERLIADGAIALDRTAAPDQIQPASLDLRLGTRVHRVRASFLPGPGRTVAERLEEFTLHTIDLSDAGAVLETGCVYIAPLMERLALPEDVAAATNPKSSTGRLDVFTRVITDSARSFDAVPAGYVGPLFAEISPRTFPVLVRPGSRLSQLRLRRGEPRLSDAELAELQDRARLVDDDDVDVKGGVAVTVDLNGDGDGLVGWRAKRHTGVVDVDAPGAHAIEDFWEPIRAGKTGLVLDPGQFYILASREAVQVPPGHAAEMTPFDPLVGEFRVHYAGFFDPGFGHSEAGGSGARAVLEVRSHEVPFILEHGQTVGRLVYERMLERPRELYGELKTSNYQGQKLKLSKHFRAG
ncbi:2'-deoxycytidine 5'-triphosphate deaminase [Methylopila sp. M107]|uniref:2'-deoxycytidine 5'-triphosphate deaminase n=1 Tax=Methylopila sp. M107 TaxID=1101190 RepID=UPI0004785069|nr:2'-deoxycytidine 5'-triphosphate deaminase [Methylopila sp. M107]